MKTAVAEIYRSYWTAVADGFRDGEMVLDDQISSIVPVGRRCLLKFVKWEV
jgi:hypothetical protein